MVKEGAFVGRGFAIVNYRRFMERESHGKMPREGVHEVDLIGVREPSQKVDVKKSNRRNYFQLALLEKLLRKNCELPRNVISLIRSFVFTSPFVFLKRPVFRLVEGSRYYHPRLTEAKQQREGGQDQPTGKQQIAKHQKYLLAIHEPYTVGKNKEFLLGNRSRLMQFRVAEVWRPVRNPKHERLLEYTSLLGDFLKKYQRYSIICEPEDQTAIKNHVDNILLNIRSYSLDITESSVLDLVRRDMIWLVDTGYGYLCMSSTRPIQNLFTISCEHGQWQFHGEDLQVWSDTETERVRSTTPCLIRFTIHDFFYLRDSALISCD